MRVLNDDKQIAILDAARKEFILKGFKDASMRNIAQEANVGLSNIYNYFKNKDEIFQEILRPARSELYSFIQEQHSEANIDYNRTTSFGHQEEVIDYYIDLICKYKEEYRLLLFHTNGSSLCDFRESFIDYLTKISFSYMDLERKHYPNMKKLSPFLVHIISSWMVTLLGEIVTHDLEKPRIREFYKEFFRFEYAGWRELTET
ncbi:TetR/AcrR family transcriptional regulator [Dysgonomonas sp.]|jgi:AcrR family transcriptional regulator|nr:TetR/AcrR family transcriptional regulator [Prevotella sp.]